jgi:hypothetical protein
MYMIGMELGSESISSVEGMVTIHSKRVETSHLLTGLEKEEIRVPARSGCCVQQFTKEAYFHVTAYFNIF